MSTCKEDKGKGKEPDEKLCNEFVDELRQGAASSILLLREDEPKRTKCGICLSMSWFGNIKAAPAARPGTPPG